MKQLIILLGTTAFGLGLFAQTDVKQTKIQNSYDYCCPKGDYCTVAQGACNAHSCSLVKDGTYYCVDCMTGNEHPGNCLKCGLKMKLMECRKIESEIKGVPIKK